MIGRAGYGDASYVRTTARVQGVRRAGVRSRRRRKVRQSWVVNELAGREVGGVGTAVTGDVNRLGAPTVGTEGGLGPFRRR